MTIISLIQNYNKYKYCHINGILYNEYNTFFDIINTNFFLKNSLNVNPNKYVNNFLIKQNKCNQQVNWKIIKDLYSSTYFLSFENLLILHFDKKKNTLSDFQFLYNNSIEYKFKIYETNNYYHLFCISKFLDLDYHNFWLFLFNNESNLKYNVLSSIYNSFLIINKGIIDYIEDNNNILHNLPCIEYKFVKYIGEGPINSHIEYTINSLINIINNYYLKYAPIHYLSIGA